MKAYILVEIKITDAALYETYKKLTPASLLPFEGKFIVRGGKSESLEGEWEAERLVILEFPNVEAAKAWWSSDEYAPAKAIRQRASYTKMLLVEGNRLTWQIGHKIISLKGKSGPMLSRLLFCSFLFTSVIAYSQDDDTIQFVQGLPVTGEDTSQNEYQSGLNTANLTKLTPEQIPPKLLRTLKKDSLFANWKNGEVYLDEKTGLYWIEFSEGNVVRTFGLSARGHPVTIRESEVLEIND
jgi:uncharacterized protein (DUF1330 family)